MRNLTFAFIILTAIACKEKAKEIKKSEMEISIEQSMDRNADSLLNKEGFNSVSIGIYKNGKTFTKHYGELDKGKGNTPNDSTIYEIASLTKTFTGTLLAKAELDGKIDLDDDIREYLKGEFPNLEYQSKPITIKDLATHTSRLPRELPNSDDLWANPNDSLPYRLNKRAEGYTKGMFYEDLKKSKLDTLSGFKYAYSNVGPELIAQILENVYNQSFNQLLENVIFDKANMNSTTFHLDSEQKKRFANGYNDKGELAPNFVVALSGADGGLKSTMSDLMNYMEFQFDKENPIVTQSHKLMAYENERHFREGYFWQIRTNEELGTYYFCHGGAYGTQNYFFLIPKYELGISVIINQSGPETSNELINVVNGLIEDIKTVPNTV